jgi:hypothetical protein
MMIIDSPPPKVRGTFWKPSAGDDLHVVKHEPMLFQADVNFAATHGGPITHAFLKEALFYLSHIGVRPQDVNLFLDSRVHMLMPGWYPCIPGWHHDDVERSREDGQPNYRTASYRPEFLMGIVGSADCGTEFATGKFMLTEPEQCPVIYKQWHGEVELSVEKGGIVGGTPCGRVSVEPNLLYRFNDRSFHQGVPSKNTGWRWFGRITIGNPTVKPANEIRRNANVYMENPMEGW